MPPRFELPKEQVATLIQQLQHYCRDELEIELGELPARLLIDFLGPKLGNAYYNRALEDARTLVADRIQSLDEDLGGLGRAVER